MASFSSSSGEKKMVLLRSCDEEEFEVEPAVAGLSKVIGFMIEDGCGDGPIPLYNVNGAILAKVLEYCKKHAAVASDGEGSAAAAAGEDLKKWDEKYMEIDTNTLYDLILAADYLNIEELLDLSCKTVADMIKGKSPEEIRKMLRIKNDFTPEEEEEILKENQWAF